MEMTLKGLLPLEEVIFVNCDMLACFNCPVVTEQAMSLTPSVRG